MRYFVFLMCFFICSLGYAQTDSLLALAERAKDQVQYKEALRYYLQATHEAERRQDKATLAKTYAEIANIYEAGEVHEKALEYLRKVYAIAPSEELELRKADIIAKTGKHMDAKKIYWGIIKNHPSNESKALYKKLPILRKIAVLNQRLEDYDSMLDVNLQILEMQYILKDNEGIRIALNNVGYTYKQMRKYNQAIRQFEDVLSLEKKQGGKTAENPISRINLGITFQNIGDHETALRYLLDANKLIEKTANKREMARMYELLAATYLSNKDYYNARYYNDLALALARQLQDKDVLQRVYENSSIIYQVEEKYDKALEDYKKHLAIRDSLVVEDRLRQQDLLQQQILIERTEKEMKLRDAQDEVKENLIKRLEAEAAKNAHEIALRTSQIDVDKERLAREESEKREAKQALELLRREAEAEKKDRALSLLKQRQALQEIELEKKSALEKERVATIANLQKDKELKDLKIANQANESQRKEAEARQYQYIVYGVVAIGTIIILLITIGLIITKRKNRQLAEQQYIIQETNAELVQTNEEIAAQRDLAESLNKQIAEKNAELVQTNEEIAAQRDLAESLNRTIGEKTESIMASIQYAQQIQQAILVAPEVISQDLPTHFILFKPRDIVSGDFYFFAHVQARLIFSAIDCTGHGVPGAFMSMIGHEILEDVVVMRQITSPDIILNELHKGIRKALKQEQTNNRDGMDLSLVSIDHENKILEFAGAKNPLIYIQNGEISHIKGDKMPIGGEQTEDTRNFTKHTISINLPTTFYMFSDGYQDQFGGKGKKKFSIGRMKELFLQIHERDMEAQKTCLQNTIEDWIAEGKEYQIDDILVIGGKA